MKRLLIVLSLCGMCAGANTWYVSPIGSDSNTCAGSGMTAACRSLNFVFTNKFACGDTIIARGGNYYIPLTEAGQPITWPTCNSSSPESTLVAFGYGWGAQLQPILDVNGGIDNVIVVNGNSLSSNGFQGSYGTGIITVGAACPGLAGATSTGFNPASLPCGSGFSATASVTGSGAIAAITVVSPGSGYPANVKVFAQSGELPTFFDMLQVWDSTNGSAPAGCQTGTAGVTGGCLVVTHNADNNDPNFPGCVTTTCNGWLASLPSNFPFTDTLFYQQGGAGPIIRRKQPIQPLKNHNPKNGDTTVCKAAGSQSAANIAFGCPSGGVPQPGGLFNCAAQVTPCPPAGFPSNTWWGGYIEWEYNTGDLNSLHSLQIGDLRIEGQEFWTYGYSRLKAATPGTPNVATMTGPFNAVQTTNAGMISQHQYYLKNRPLDVIKGYSYLDRCPSQWSGASSCNSGTPESTWKLFTAADPSAPGGGENPQNDVYWVPTQAPPLMQATAMNNFQIIGVSFQGGNYPVPANGIASLQGQPNVPDIFTFGTINSTTLMQNITLQGIISQHTGAEGWGFHGNIQNLTIQDSAFVDGWGALMRIGDIAQNSDVCNGGSKNVPGNFVMRNTLINACQREDPTGEALCVYIGDVNGWTVDHNDMFRSYTGEINAGHGLNLGAEGGQLSYCMGNWSVTNNHMEGEENAGGTLAIATDAGILYGAWNHSPNSPAGSLFSDPNLNPSLYTGTISGNFILHGACDPALSNVAHCFAGIYGDQGTWGANVFNNVIGYIGGEDIEAHLSSHGTTGFKAAQFVPQHFYVHNNILYGCGSNQESSGSVYRRGTIALGTWVIDQNIEVCDTSADSSGGNQFRQNLFNGFWAAYDQSDAIITNHGSPTCAGAVSCASPATATVNGCTGAVVSLAVDSIAGAFSGLIGVNIDTPGTGCSSPTLTFSNCPSCAATLCVSGGSLVTCTSPAVSASTAYNFGNGHGNLVWDPRGSFPKSGICFIPSCNTGAQLFASFPWQGNDTLSVNDDPRFVDPTFPNLDFHPTNWAALNKINFVMWRYEDSGRTFPVIGANSPINLFPALGTQLILDSSYNPSYIVRPVTSWNSAGGAGLTVWK